MYRFLIIDENPDSFQSYVSFLKTKECFVDVSTDPANIVSMLSEFSYDLVLMESRLSFTDAFELCQSIRCRTNVPVIFLSDASDEATQLRAFSSGACDYILKGTSPDLFWARLYSRAYSYQNQPDTLRRFPPLTLDLQRQKAFIDGIHLRLTQIEFSLLSLLSSRPGVIWSVEELYSEIWGTNSIPDPQIVQAHLSRMRRKLEKAYPRHDFIETIWRKGYQFVPAKNTNTTI